MSRWTARFALLLIVAFLAPASGTEEQRPDAAWNRRPADQAFCQGILDLGEWCRANDMVLEARACYEFMRKALPDEEPLRDQASRALSELPAPKHRIAAASRRKSYQDRVMAFCKAAADRYFELYRTRPEGTDPDQARKLLDHVLVIWEDHPGAREARGEERVDGLGWHPRKEARALRGQVHSTPHYRIRSDAPDEEVAEYGALLEWMYKEFFSFCGTKLDRPDHPMGVQYFAREEDYRAWQEKAMGGANPHVIGFYDHRRRVSSFFRRDFKGSGSDLGVLFHESVHQLIHLGSNGKLPTSLPFVQRIGGDETIHFWLVEGIACYFETYRWDGGGLVQDPSGPRYRRCADCVAKRDHIRLREFFTLGQKRFMDGGGQAVAARYDQAATLVRFFLEGAGRKYREKFFRFLSAFYQGDVDLDTFRDLFEKSADQIEKEWLLYVQNEMPK